jgi:hypothetical protein
VTYSSVIPGPRSGARNPEPFWSQVSNAANHVLRDSGFRAPLRGPGMTAKKDGPAMKSLERNTGVPRQNPYIPIITGARLRASGCRALTPVNEEN